VLGHISRTSTFGKLPASQIFKFCKLLRFYLFRELIFIVDNFYNNWYVLFDCFILVSVIVVGIWQTGYPYIQASS
jgi:hypothetical protein